jgi:hypothetical protein
MESKFNVACHKPSNDTYFNDVVTLKSSVFQTPEERAAAVRKIYEGVTPPIQVLMITQLMEVERGFF